MMSKSIDHNHPEKFGKHLHCNREQKELCYTGEESWMLLKELIEKLKLLLLSFILGTHIMLSIISCCF